MTRFSSGETVLREGKQPSRKVDIWFKTRAAPRRIASDKSCEFDRASEQCYGQVYDEDARDKVTVSRCCSAPKSVFTLRK